MNRTGHTDQGEHPARRAERGEGVVCGLEPFPLFCAYHLGLTGPQSYRFMNIHQVARHFEVSVDDVQQALIAYQLDSDVLLHIGFDLAAAQADVQLSPAGVDLYALARMHYDTLLQAPTKARDWERELARAAEENDEIFGKDRG
ncbi:MAG: hypothetical protein ACO3JL_01445 [Myxococcota bacterium]